MGTLVFCDYMRRKKNKGGKGEKPLNAMHKIHEKKKGITEDQMVGWHH